MAITLNDWAGKGIGVNPTGSDYPFVEPSDDIAGILSDLYLSHAYKTAVLPLRVIWLYGVNKAFENVQANVAPQPPDSNGDNPVDIVIWDAADVEIFNSRTSCQAYYARNFGTRLRIHEWVTDSAVCRIVQHCAFVSAAAEVTIPETIEPISAILHERCSVLLPTRVDSFYVLGGQRTKDIVFSSGYNAQLSAEPSLTDYGLRAGTRVTINLEPGLGLGRFGDCAEEGPPAVKKINNVPVSGNVKFDFKECYWIRPQLEYYRYGSGDPEPFTWVPGSETLNVKYARVNAHALEVGNDCGPCCTCDDFVRVFKGVKVIYDRYQQLGVQVDAINAEYNDIRDRWLSQKACREADVINIDAIAYSGNVADVVIGICSNMNYCLKKVVAEVSIYYNTNGIAELADPEEVTVSGVVKNDPAGRFDFYTFEGNNPLYAYWESLNLGTAGQLRFRMSFPNDFTKSVTVRVSVTTLEEAYGTPKEVTFTMTSTT